MHRIAKLLFGSLYLFQGCAIVHRYPPPPESDFSVMTWNIWHGGREDGEIVGPERVIRMIKNTKADIVAIQETYGSGELISQALGFHFLPRGTNVSIMSRFPIVENISVFQEFKCVGAIIELPDQSLIAFYSVWLPYDEDIWVTGSRYGKTDEELIAACASSARDIEQIVTLAKAKLASLQLADIPIIIAGDFNSMSHLDYTNEAKNQYGRVIEWPTSKFMSNAGFTDSYRKLHRINRTLDRTWSPRFLNQEQDRIDFIYFSNGSMKPVGSGSLSRRIESRNLLNELVSIPSDHAAVITRFKLP